MRRISISLFLFGLLLLGANSAPVFAGASNVEPLGNQNQGVSFDAPAIAQARILSSSHVVTVKKPVVNLIEPSEGADAAGMVSEGSNEYQLNPTPREMLVEIVIPVSTVMEPKWRDQMKEFRFDVFWNRTAYPLVDYGPRTSTSSSIAGTISKEQNNSRDSSAGLNLSGGFEPLDSASLSANLSGKRSTSQRFQEIPQHDVPVSYTHLTLPTKA